MTHHDDALVAFDAAFPLVAPIAGWLTEAQARDLFLAARQLPPGSEVIEVGSHQGRSTIALASAREDLDLVAIDPFVDGWKFGGASTRDLFEQNLEAAGVRLRVRLLVQPSDEVRGPWSTPVHLVFIDGKHDARSAAHDLRWAEHLVPEGRLFLHDAFSSIGVTLAVLGTVLPGSTLRYVGRTGSLAEFVRDTPTRESRLAILGELPWWARNVGLKVLLRLRLRGLARRLGHHDRWDPY